MPLWAHYGKNQEKMMDISRFLLEFTHWLCCYFPTFFLSLWDVLYCKVKYQLLTSLITNKSHWPWKTIHTDAFCPWWKPRECVFPRICIFHISCLLFPSVEGFSIMARWRWLKFCVLLILVCSSSVHNPLTVLVMSGIWIEVRESHRWPAASTPP